MTFLWRKFIFLLLVFSSTNNSILGQQENGNPEGVMTVPPVPHRDLESCNGIFLAYEFLSREKEYPRQKNITAQSWAFKSVATVLNTGTVELENWKLFVGFQHREILVGADGGVMDSQLEFPADVSNGTHFSGSSLQNLKTSIETAGDLNQIQAQIKFTGTQFGIKPPGVPMPKKLLLDNPGYECPGIKQRRKIMYVCCIKNKKLKPKLVKEKLLARQSGDLTITYDVTQAYPNSYMALVTMENHSPLGRLDHWNLTWEWMRGEFIYSMKGAFTYVVNFRDCIYGKPGQVYGDMDFSKVMNCEKNPIIGDLPLEKANDTQVGKIPHCCRNGTILPKLMDPSQSKSAFQMQVFKMPPDVNRTTLFPPQKWKIYGILNPEYKCGTPKKVSPTQFPDTSGLQSYTLAIATWQVVCNITKAKEKPPKCCVSYSAYYNDSVIPCNTCACGCENPENCNPHTPAMFLPSESLLVPFENRSVKAKAWARLKHLPIPRVLPCSDNCGVSINWHISTDYKNGWSARITLFNWQKFNFENWFTAIQVKKASKGYEKAYSFNGTFLRNQDNTIFLQGLVGLNFLMGAKNGSHSRRDPLVPGKQQTVISFTKKYNRGINILKGDGFPTKVLFNGEECALPHTFPIGTNGVGKNFRVEILHVILPVFISFIYLGLGLKNN